MINSFDPATIDPTGQDNPLDRQNMTLSICLVNSVTGTLMASNIEITSADVINTGVNTVAKINFTDAIMTDSDLNSGASVVIEVKDSTITNAAIWPAIAAGESQTEWAFNELIEVVGWFDDIEPVLHIREEK